LLLAGTPALLMNIFGEPSTRPNVWNSFWMLLLHAVCTAPSKSVADPDILKRGAGRKAMYQRRRHLSQMHTTNYMPFIREKDGLLNKILSQ